MSRPVSDAEIVATVAGDLPIGVWVARAPSGALVYANRRFTEIMGITAREDVAVGAYSAPYGIHTRSGELYPEDGLPFVRALRARATVTVDDIVIHRHDGGRVNIRAEARPIFDDDGDITHVIIAFTDVTREVTAELARADSEARLFAAQKMESLGSLAGGVAHDFNNILAAIGVIASSLRRDEPTEPRREALDQIVQATESAAQLTRALLGFARRGKNLAARVSLHEIVERVARLVGRGMGRGLALDVDLRATTDAVIGDASQIEQVLMNLAVNAREAMPDEGRLTFRTREVDLSAADCARLPPLEEGRHVVLEVIDTGPGIASSVRGRIFEPFFTTKPVAGGSSGLGLATVFGIVQSHGGAIEALDAEPTGTTMRVFLRVAPAVAPVEAPPPASARAVEEGRGTLLLVDDEPMLRRAMARALRQLGYGVLTAENGAVGVEVYREHRGEIDLVILDMVMPKLDGRGCYLAMRAIDPDVRVLLTTGYSLNEEAQRILDLGVRGFIAKPYDVRALSVEIARLMRAT